MYPRPARLHLRAALPPRDSAPRDMTSATSSWRSFGFADTRSRLRFARKTPRSHSVPHDHAAGGHRSIAGVKPLNFEARTISDAGFLECFALENICRPDSMFRRRGFSLALLTEVEHFNGEML